MRIKKTRGSLRQFGTRVARAIWFEKRSWQRLGVLVLGLCALIGVTRATNIQKLYAGASKDTPTNQALTTQTVSKASANVNSTAAETTEEKTNQA